MMNSQRLIKQLARRTAAARQFTTGTRPLLQAADKDQKYDVNPEQPEIAPTTIPWKSYKNEYYEKRGYTVAPQSWTEWEGLPAPYKYLGVKVNPEHVENHGPIWKFFSDWRTGVPATILLSLPLWMFNILPPFDERLELAFITISAGWVAVGQAGPMFRQWKRARVATKVQALLGLEKEVNDQIESSMNAFKAGSAVVDYIKMINDGERALRSVEAAASTRRIANAQREALVAQLDYLKQISSSGAADTEAAVVKAARTIVETQLEKDAALQQKTVDAAVKALKDGTVAEDLITPLYTQALAKAREELANKPSGESNPLKNSQVIEIFKKRFGYTEDVVSEGTLARAQSDAAALAVLTGRVGGKAPQVGASYVLKAPIAYAK